MLGIGDRFPQLTVPVQQGVEALPGGETMDLSQTNGRWRVYLFWPRDFTSVCPTEVAAFGELCDEIRARNAELIGASTDSAHMHLAWRKSDPRLAACDFPWIADESHELADALGIFDAEEGMTRRVTFITDPDGVIQHVTANALLVGRNSAETMRILDALQSGVEAPCNWMPSAAVLNG